MLSSLKPPGILSAVMFIMLTLRSVAGLRTRGMRLTPALVVSLVTLWVGNPAAWGSPVLCSGVNSLGDWASSTDGCVDAQVRYTLIDSTLPKTTAFVASSILLPSGTVHLVVFTFRGGLAPGTYSLEYEMEFARGDSMFGSVSGDTSVAGK